MKKKYCGFMQEHLIVTNGHLDIIERASRMF